MKKKTIIGIIVGAVSVVIGYVLYIAGFLKIGKSMTDDEF